MRNVRQIARSVHVAFEGRRRLDAMLDPVEASGDGCRECEIGIRVRAWGATLDAQRWTVTDDAKTGGAIVVAPRDSSRRERPRDVAFVRRGIRRIKREKLANVLHPAAQKITEGRGTVDGAELLFAVEHRLACVLVPQAHVNVAARSGVALVPLGHEGDRASELPCDFFGGMF